MFDPMGLRTAQFDAPRRIIEQALTSFGIGTLMAYEGGFGRDALALPIRGFE